MPQVSSTYVGHRDVAATAAPPSPTNSQELHFSLKVSKQSIYNNNRPIDFYKYSYYAYLQVQFLTVYNIENKYL